MARVFPNGWREVNPLADIGRELETLELLGNSLDDSYTVYHGVHWTNVESKNYAIYGEIDFAVVSPSGKLLLIEQKTGYLDETDDGLEKKYAEKSKNVPFQIARNAHGLQHRLKQALKGNSVFVDSILYCPRKLTQMVNKLKIETSISLRMRDEEVEIHGKSNCWDIGRRGSWPARG
jgi:hypothetical protein